MRCLAIPAAIAALLVLPPAAVARPSTLWTGFKVRHSFAVRPPAISYTGDSTGFLGGFDGTGIFPNYGSLTWNSWTHHSASATGAVWLNNCTPSCGEGSFSAVAVTVTAFKAKKSHFRRMTLQYTYQGKSYTDRRVLRPGFFRGSYVWAIAGLG